MRHVRYMRTFLFAVKVIQRETRQKERKKEEGGYYPKNVMTSRGGEKCINNR